MGKKKNYKELLTTPFETHIKGFSYIANYFLYYAPNIDSANSVGKIEGERAKQVFDEMIVRCKMNKKFKVLQKVRSETWKSHDLHEDSLDFEIPRMIFDKYKNENELQALLRHIRNALAHGFIYVWKKKKGNYIFLTDYDKKKEKVTAKIMISSKILEQWKAILENEII